MRLEIHFIYKAKKKFNAFFKHATETMFYFPQMPNYIIISSLSVQKIFTFLTKHALKFQHPAQQDRG